VRAHGARSFHRTESEDVEFHGIREWLLDGSTN
jgi:hypothetical protein